MPSKGSAGERAVAIELVGPLVDDRGAMSRTLGNTVRAAGFEPRPGALDQVAGAAVTWAVATLLEGHGRQDMVPSELEGRVRSAWQEAARSAPVLAAPGAVDWWRRLLASGQPVVVFTGLPRETALLIADRAGFGDIDGLLIDAGGTTGLPRPDALAGRIDALELLAADAMAAASSPSALLAAIAAGIGHVVLVGEGSSAAAMLAERRVTRLDQLDGA